MPKRAQSITINCDAKRKDKIDVVVGEKSSTMTSAAAATDCKENKQEETQTSFATTSDIEENLICSICLEIIHDCVSLQPCLHSFCAGCCSTWLDQAKSNSTKPFCPSCHSKIKCVGRNHMMNNVILSWLKKHPEKQRSPDDLAQLDAANTIKSKLVDCRSMNSSEGDSETEHRSRPSSTSSNTSSVDTLEYEEDEDSDTSEYVYVPTPPPRLPARRNICRECDPHSGSAFVCAYDQGHVLCQCCFSPMPDRRDELRLVPDEPQQQCASCFKVFCDAYWNCIVPGCISTLRNISFTDYSSVICKNPVETLIFHEWMLSKNITWNDLIRRMADEIDRGEYVLQSVKIAILPTNLSQIHMCRSCAFNEFSTYCYNVREKIDIDELPDTVREKPNCYWGKNCWTQWKKPTHAQRYNHICEQTRF